MHVAIDIDGTLTEYPAQFKKLMRALIVPSRLASLSENRITILTGSTASPVLLPRERQLSELGIPLEFYSTLAVCFAPTIQGVAEKKGEYCRDNQVDMLFEDTPLYVEAVKRISPQTCCFLIVK